MKKPIKMDYYTDPYCAWCWALQPRLEALLPSDAAGLDLHYFQFPLIEDLAKSGMTGESVAAAWERIGKLTGRPIDAGLWRTEPPQSTLPANRASKAAGLQGVAAEGRFLQFLRPLLLLERKAADEATVLEAAKKASLDLEAFRKALLSPELDALIEADKTSARESGVKSTPAVIFTDASGDRIVIEGPRDLELFRKAISVLRLEDEVREKSD